MNILKTLTTHREKNNCIRKRKNKHRRTLRIEELESREMLSATPFAFGEEAGGRRQEAGDRSCRCAGLRRCVRCRCPPHCRRVANAGKFADNYDHHTTYESDRGSRTNRNIYDCGYYNSPPFAISMV